MIMTPTQPSPFNRSSGDCQNKQVSELKQGCARMVLSIVANC